jgi:hypothetical protein
MKKRKKYLILPLLLALLLLPLAAGCQEKEAAEPTATPTPSATSEFGQEQIQQIFAGSIAATMNAQTYKFEMDMTASMETIGGSQAGNLNMAMKGSGVYDQINKKMHVTTDINMDTNLPDIEEGMQNMSMEMYKFEENMYMKVDMPVIGEQWLKMPFTEEMMSVYNADMVGEQLKLLEAPVEMKFVRYETEDGSDCYVFRIVPDMIKIMQWVAQLQMTGAEFDLEKIPNIADVFKNMSYFIWIARDGGLMKKIEASVTMEFDAEQFGAKDGDFDNMKMNIDMVTRLYDYDKPVVIELPEEAKNAVDMSQMGGFGKK